MQFSFIIPTYNNKVLLRNTLEALNYQKGFNKDDYEVIIADDGSIDGTKDYIKNVNQNYNLNYLYLPRCKDSSRARNRNHGWRNAKGEFVIFIDSDILVNRNYLQELSRCFSLNKNSMVIGNRLMLSREINLKDIQDNEVFTKNSFDPQNYQMLELRYYHYEKASYNINAHLCPWLLVYSCNLALPKEYLDIYGGFDEKYQSWGMEDLDLGYSLSVKGLNIIHNVKLEVLHQFHGKSNDFIIESNNIAGYERNIDYFLKKFPDALKMKNKQAYKFLKGQFSMDIININSNFKVQEIEFRSRDQLNQIKDRLLKYINDPHIKVILYDFVEDTDLDLWIQLLGKTKSIVRYYPMSRKFDARKMKAYMNEIRKKMKQSG